MSPSTIRRHARDLERRAENIRATQRQACFDLLSAARNLRDAAGIIESVNRRLESCE